MREQSDTVDRRPSGFTHRTVTDTHFDAASVARRSVFVALLVVGTLPLSFVFATDFSPFLVYAPFYATLGFVAFALRTPNWEDEGGNASERSETRATDPAD